MKNLLFGLLFLGSFYANAGLPSEDPIIKTLRENFRNGNAPSISYLQNSTFQCSKYQAMEMNFDQIDIGLQRFLYNSVTHSFKEKISGENFTLNNIELSGAGYEGRTTCVNYDSYRVDVRHNFLIREESRSCPNSGSVLDPISPYPQGNSFVRSYTVCTPQYL